MDDFIFISASGASRKLNVSLEKFFGAIHSGKIAPDAKVTNGQLLFRVDSLPVLAQRLNVPSPQL